MSEVVKTLRKIWKFLNTPLFVVMSYSDWRKLRKTQIINVTNVTNTMDANIDAMVQSAIREMRKGSR